MTIWLTQSVGWSVLTRTSSHVRMFSSWSNPSLTFYGMDFIGSATGSMDSHTFNALTPWSISDFSSKTEAYLSKCGERIYYLVSSWLLKRELSSVVDYHCRYAQETERDKVSNNRRTTRQLLRRMVTVFKWTGAATLQTSMFVTFGLFCPCPNKLSWHKQPITHARLVHYNTSNIQQYQIYGEWMNHRRTTSNPLCWVLFFCC